MSSTETSESQPVTRECALCGLVTEDNVVVCPVDGSALVTCRPDPLIGTKLAQRFHIHSLIGTGGMGNVYKATDIRVDRTVAVKVLHSEKLHKRAALLRFQQEAKAAAALSHPNIVSFFDFGLTEENLPFLVMDYIEGQPLDHALACGTLTTERFIRIFSQACDALDHAHQKGIIHRDVKPSNIMLVNQGTTRDTVKILDFSIAKMLPREDTPERIALTQTGELFGSPLYMSPEQFNGQPLDARSDMYSLACVMYESLAGKPPVTGDSILDLIHQHTHERPAPLKSVNPALDVPDQVEAIIFKALEKDPDLRFPTMAALKHNLEFVPVFAEKEKEAAEIPAPAPSGARPPAIAIICLVGALVVAATIGVGISLRQPAHPPVVAGPAVPGNNPSPNDQPIAAQPPAASVPTYEMAVALYSRAQARELTAPEDSKADYGKALDIMRALAQNNRAQEHYSANLASETPIDEKVLELETKLNGEKSAALPVERLDLADDLRFSGKLDEAAAIYQQLSNDETLPEQVQQRIKTALASLAEAYKQKFQPGSTP